MVDILPVGAWEGGGMAGVALAFVVVVVEALFVLEAAGGAALVDVCARMGVEQMAPRPRVHAKER